MEPRYDKQGRGEEDRKIAWVRPLEEVGAIALVGLIIYQRIEQFDAAVPAIRTTLVLVLEYQNSTSTWSG